MCFYGNKKKQESNGALGFLVKLLAVCGLIVAALVVIDVIYKKYKKCIATIGADDCLDDYDDDFFTDCCCGCDDDLLDCEDEMSIGCDCGCEDTCELAKDDEADAE